MIAPYPLWLQDRVNILGRVCSFFALEFSVASWGNIWNYLYFLGCAWASQQSQVDSAARIRLPLAEDKEVQPTTRVEIPGVIIDTILGRLFLSPRRLNKIHHPSRWLLLDHFLLLAGCKAFSDYFQQPSSCFQSVVHSHIIICNVHFVSV